jgi:hypothetical protein
MCCAATAEAEKQVSNVGTVTGPPGTQLPLTALQLPLAPHVTRGAPLTPAVKLALQVAVQTAPTVLLLEQLKVAFGGLVGGLEHVTAATAAAAAAVTLGSVLAAAAAAAAAAARDGSSCAVLASGALTAAGAWAVGT